MDWTSFIGIAGFIILAYIIVYSIVDRICRCKEHCATAGFVSQIFAGKLKNSEITDVTEMVNKFQAEVKSCR